MLKKEKVSMLSPSMFKASILFVLLIWPRQSVANDLATRAEIVPHKALYAVELVEARNDAQIINVSGQMLYEWQPTCDAWLSQHTFDLSYEYADSPAMRMTSRFKTHESFNGDLMSFKVKREQNGHLIEIIDGHATKNPQGGGEVVYSTPSDLGFTLPSDSLFPMAHTIEMLERIKIDQRFYKAVVFDGSDKKGPMEMNSFISKDLHVPTDITNSQLDKALMKSPAHRLRLAFFSIEQRAPAPDYEMDITLHENGVISDMHAEYKDFTVRQKLVALVPLETQCVPERNK